MIKKYITIALIIIWGRTRQNIKILSFHHEMIYNFEHFYFQTKYNLNFDNAFGTSRRANWNYHSSIFLLLDSFMETLEEIFHSDGFIEKSAVWTVGGAPVRWATRERIQFCCILVFMIIKIRIIDVKILLRLIVPSRIIFACVHACVQWWCSGPTPGQYESNCVYFIWELFSGTQFEGSYIQKWKSKNIAWIFVYFCYLLQ